MFFILLSHGFGKFSPPPPPVPCPQPLGNAPLLLKLPFQHPPNVQKKLNWKWRSSDHIIDSSTWDGIIRFGTKATKAQALEFLIESASFRDDDRPWGGVFQDWRSQARGPSEKNNLLTSPLHSTDTCGFHGLQIPLALEKLTVQVWCRAGGIQKMNFILLTSTKAEKL